MMNLKQLFCLASLFLLGSCGFVGEKPLESKEIYTSSQIGACDIDGEAFAKFLEEDIDQAIRCLEQNFKDFSNNVESDNQQLLNKGQISLFVEKYMEDQKDSVLKALDLLFKINMLILKDHPDYISAANFPQVSKLLLVTNRSAVKLKRIYDSLDREEISKKEFEEKRVELQATINFFSKNIVEIINSVMGPSREINLTELIEDLKNTLGDDQRVKIDMDQVNDLLVLKTILVGGNKEVLTTNEVLRLLDNLPTLVMVIYDAYYARDCHFSNGELGLYRHYGKVVDQFKTIFASRNGQEQLFTKEESFKIADYIADYDDADKIDRNKARGMVEAFFVLKSHAVSPSQEVVQVFDVEKLFFYAQMVLESTASISEINKILDSEATEAIKRQRFAQITAEAQRNLLDIYKAKAFTLPAFDLMKLVKAIRPGIEESEIAEVDFDLIEKLIPLKKVILGGTKTDFNQDQLKILIDKFPSLFLMAYDASNYKAEDYQRDEDKFGFFIDLIRQGKSMIFNFANPKNELIYTLEELVATIDYATDSEYNVSKFSDSIETLVVKFLKGSPNRLTVQDIKTLLNYAEEMAEGVFYNSLAYDHNTYLLNHPGRIEGKHLRSFPVEKQNRLNAKRVSELHREFSILVEKLRFYRTKEGQQYYSHDTIRTKYGLNEASMGRFAVKRLLEAYCPAPNNNPESCGVSDKILNDFLHDFKSLLVEVNLWSSNMKTFASNVLYLADLLQTQSNGDQRIGLDEGTEYVGLILTAVKMADEVKNGLVERCGNYTQGTLEEQEANPTIELGCFRQNVLDVWLNQLGYKNYLTAFARYYKESSPAVMQEYIQYLEQVVHENKDENFMRVRDIALFIGAIQNVESMLIRFDINRNNFLNPNEVDQAFGVYENLIVDLGGLSGSKRQYAKSAFLFMVKEMTFPSTSDVLKFHYNPFASKEVSAHRLNVASILYYFTTL